MCNALFKILSIWYFLPLLAILSVGANGEESTPAATFRGGINSVRIDAFVTDAAGNAVPDLNLQDFEIYEDEVEQELQSVQFIRTSGSDPEARAFVIFFDDYHVQLGHSWRIQNLLIDFIDQLRPTDLVGIMFPLTPLEAVVFTHNHRAVQRAIQTFQGTRFRYDIRNSFEGRYNHYPLEYIEQIRNEVSLSALNALMIKLGNRPEVHKSVLLVSEGYTNYVPPHLRHQSPDTVDPHSGFGGLHMHDEQRNSHEETRSFFREGELINRVNRVTKAAGQANTSIYPLDPNGLGGNISGVERQVTRNSQNTLRQLAANTEGRTLIGAGARSGLQQILDEHGDYYLLSYNSDAPSDGKFHQVEVKVKRPGLKVRARKGYWAATADDLRRQQTTKQKKNLPQIVTNAMESLSRKLVKQLIVRTWMGIFPSSREDRDEGQIRFAWEPNPEWPGERHRPSRLHVTATDEKTGITYFDDYVSRAPLPSTQFNVSPGTIKLQVWVEDENGKIIDRNREEVDVPDFKSLKLPLSTPFFVRGRNAFELKKLAADWEVSPATAPHFYRNDHLLVRFGLHPTQTDVKIQVDLLGSDGETLMALNDSLSYVEGRGYQLQLVPSFLARGNYLIKISAKLGSNGLEATKMLAFRIRR